MAEDEPIEVPADSLAPETLRAVLEAFVNREGTDYGAVERTLDEKVADVHRQLARGEARLVFDPGTQSVTLVPAPGRPGAPSPEPDPSPDGTDGP